MTAHRGAPWPAPEDREAVVTYQLTVLYHQPADPEAFDRYYDSTHVPLASTLPGLRSYTGSHPGPDPAGNPAPYHLVAVLTWDSEEALAAAMGGPEGQAALDDLPNFAGAGVDVAIGPVRQYV